MTANYRRESTTRNAPYWVHYYGPSQTAIEQLNNNRQLKQSILEKRKTNYINCSFAIRRSDTKPNVANIDDLEQQVSVQQTELTQITTQLNQHEYKVDFNKTKLLQ